MTAISFVAPYAPQPVAAAAGALNFADTQVTLPVANSSESGHTGLASDQSGQGAGNGTGTGGAQLVALLNRGRETALIDRATPESVIEAQSDSDPATEFLARQAQTKANAEAQRAAEAAQLAAAREDHAQKEAAEAAKPEFKLPNPIPTAPILELDEN